MTWFHVQFVARNALQFLYSNFQRDGKPAIIARKLQRVARNELHTKPRLVLTRDGTVQM